MRYIKLVILSVFCAFGVQAEETALNTDQIQALLSGNSVAGVHYGNRTAQYFSESGLTLWMKEDDVKPSEGQWKAEQDQYCSNFGSDWGCYQVVNDTDQGVYYFLRDGFRAPFIVKEGFVLGF